MKATKLMPGDPVMVYDEGLLMLQRFAPVNVFPNNWGWVMDEPADDGELMIEFPIGNDLLDEHSQAAPYPVNKIRPRSGQTRDEYLAWQKAGGKQK